MMLLRPPPPNFQGNVKATQESKARAMMVPGIDQNFAFPVAIILLSLHGSHSPAAYKRGSTTYRFIRWGSCWYLRWMNIGKSLVSPHWQSIEIRLQEEKGNIRDTAPIWVFWGLLYGKGDTHIFSIYSRYILNIYIYSRAKKEKKCLEEF